MLSDERIHKHNIEISHTDIFSKIYRQKIWGNGVRAPLSGSGSKVNYNQKYIKFLPHFINDIISNLYFNIY